jgi:hypothetical protein
MAGCAKCRPGQPCSWHGGRVKFTSEIKREERSRKKIQRKMENQIYESTRTK